MDISHCLLRKSNTHIAHPYYVPSTALHMFIMLCVHNSQTCGFSAGMMDTALHPRYSKDRKDPGRLSCLPQVAEMEVYPRNGSLIPTIISLTLQGKQSVIFIGININILYVDDVSSYVSKNVFFNQKESMTVELKDRSKNGPWCEMTEWKETQGTRWVVGWRGGRGGA